MTFLRHAAVLAAALLLASAAPAWAHTDGGPELSLVWPAQGTITTGFHPDAAEPHDGIDIGMLRSLDVTAAASGLVETVGDATGFEGYGTIVLVDLGGGFEALYAHLSETDVHPGDVVTVGQKLGLAGCTGLCTGTHLHFEMRYRGVPLDPLSLLPATIAAPEGG